MTHRQFPTFAIQALQPKMKSGKLFLGFAITLLMMDFSANAAKQSAFQNPEKKVASSSQILVYSMSLTGHPAEGSHKSNIPEIKATTSCRNLPTSFYVHSNQEIISLFEIRFEEITLGLYLLSAPVTLNRFFLYLFTVIISPNAP